MASQHSRRGFLRSVSHGTLIATLGPAMAVDLGLTSQAFASIATEPQPLSFGDLEPLVCLLQETEPQKLQAAIFQKIKDQTSLKSLISAAAFANARTFGGEDYIGFHTFMALSPAYRMSSMMPLGQEALPVLKVLYRNTSRIHEFGGRSSETLQQIVAADVGATPQELQKAIRAQELAHAEALLASIGSPDSRLALEALLPCVQDNPEVHRTVLPYRAWDMQNLVGADHAITLLRQSLHYCVRMEPHRKESWNDHSQMLARLMDEFHLDSKSAGSRAADDELFHHLSHTFVTASPEDCAKAAASALAEGILPSSIGEAISHAASQLVLMDAGRLPQWEDRLKPAGSVHGDSVGVHASDSANAWRNMAGVCQGQSQFACLIIGAWQIARDRITPGNLLTESLPAKHHLDRLQSKDPAELLNQLEVAIRDNLQGTAAAIAFRYGELQLPPDQIFSKLLQFAVSEDGALHAEKYFHTVWDDFHATRKSARWQHIVALARVTASEYGRPAAGQLEAKRLLGIT